MLSALACLVGTGLAAATEPMAIDPTELVVPTKPEVAGWLARLTTKYNGQVVKFSGQATAGEEFGSILLSVPAKGNSRNLDVLVYVRDAKSLVGKKVTVEGRAKVVTDKKAKHPVQIDNAEVK
jgi:hypothetical protein